MSGLLITGTDTGVGKTVVAAAVCAWLVEQGHSVHPLKPVESGTDENGGVPGDAQLLARSVGLDSWRDACVLALPEPLAPLVAARRAGLTVDQVVLDDAFVERRARGGTTVVEGVGGALVEVSAGVTVADLAARWALPAIVVAANRLGVLSHTLLTVEALQSRGVEVRGVVLNTLSADPPTVAEQENAAELSRLLPQGVPLLGTMPFVSQEGAESPSALASLVAQWGGMLFPDRP